MSLRASVVRRSRGMLACVVAAGALVWGAASSADVFEIVPAEALGVLKVRNLKEVSAKWGDFSAKLGLAAFSPEMADPLGAIKSQLGIEAGLREDGELGLVLLPASAWSTDESGPAAVLLVPVSDYAAFVGNFKDAETSDGVTKATRDGEDVFIAQWGDYAAVGSSREHVLMKGEGVALSPHAAGELTSKDVVLWANVPVLRAALAGGLEEARTTALEALNEQLSGDASSAKYRDVIAAATTQVFVALESFLRDARSATVSLHLTDAGINSSLAAEFERGSYLGGWVSSLKPETENVTAGLPAGSYIIFGGLVGGGEALAQLTRDVAGPVVEALKNVEGGNADAVALIDATERLFRHARRTVFGWVAPRGQVGTESLLQMAFTVEGDAAAYMAAFKDYSTAYARVSSAFEGTQVNPFNVEFKPAHRVVAGVTFDSLVMGYPPNPRTPEEAMMQQMMRMIYGPTGLSYDVGAVSDTRVLCAFGMNEGTVARFVAALREGQDPVGGLANVQRTAAELPTGSFAVVYLALDELIRTGTHYAQQFGIPVNLQLPPNLSPIGIALASQGTVLKANTHVPMDLLQSIIAAAIQMQMGGGM